MGIYAGGSNLGSGGDGCRKKVSTWSLIWGSSGRRRSIYFLGGRNPLKGRLLFYRFEREIFSGFTDIYIYISIMVALMVDRLASLIGGALVLMVLAQESPSLSRNFDRLNRLLIWAVPPISGSCTYNYTLFKRPKTRSRGPLLSPTVRYVCQLGKSQGKTWLICSIEAGTNMNRFSLRDALTWGGPML